jgi:hypothetical protein
VDRTSGRDGERRAAEYLARKLKEYGVRHTVHETRLYMSWPVSAEMSIGGAAPLVIKGAAPAFGASTPPGGLTAAVVFLAADQSLGPEVRGKIVVASGGGVSTNQPVRSTANQQRPSAGSFGELEELGFRQVWEIELLREGAEAVLVDDLPAIGFHREVDDLRLQIERVPARTRVPTVSK